MNTLINYFQFPHVECYIYNEILLHFHHHNQSWHLFTHLPPLLHWQPHSPLLLLLLLFFFYSFSLIEASSVDLIHRDSPNSPFYNPSEIPSQCITKVVRRSISHVNRFKPTSSLSTNAAQSDISSNGGEYLLKYFVGTPPIEILGFADTSTDLIWLQCEPCSIRYNHYKKRGL